MQLALCLQIGWLGVPAYSFLQAQSLAAAAPCCRAAWLGDSGAIAEYAAAGGDVNARDRKGQVPLQFAAGELPQCGRIGRQAWQLGPEGACWPSSHALHPGNTAPPCFASTNPPTGYGREAAVKLLLQLGAGTSAAADRSGMAALHRAAARNHAGVVRLLLAGGASACQCSAVGQTPLMYASQFGHEAVVRLLLLHLAAAGQRAEQAQHTDVPDGGGGGDGSSGEGSLRQHLALCDAAGLSALHLTAQWGMAAVAEQLLEAGAGRERCAAWLRKHAAMPAEQGLGGALFLAGLTPVCGPRHACRPRPAFSLRAPPGPLPPCRTLGPRSRVVRAAAAWR